MDETQQSLRAEEGTWETEQNSPSDESTSFIPKAFRPGQNGRSSPDNGSWISTFFKLFPWVLSALLILALFLEKQQKQNLKFSKLPPVCAEHRQEQYSPAGETIRYHDVMFYRAFGSQDSGHLSPFQGWPSDEKDKLWEDMYAKGILIGIDEDSHGKLLNSSERVAQEGQTSRFMVGIDVFHQLHCLDALRRSIYPKRYNMSLVDADGSVNYGHWMHLDHCVESLRQSLTCSADVAAYTYEWLDTAKLMMARVGGLHRCRDFQAIQDWTFSQHVDPASMRTRVEPAAGGGFRLVDYSDQVDYRKKGWIPPGWHHTADEL